MKQDYNRLMEERIATLGGRKPRLLLHSCCAPCTSSVLERLRPFFSVTLYYFNPNTHPENEYIKRGNELKKLLSASGADDVEIIWGDYRSDDYFSAVRGLENEPEGGKRCDPCFRLRLSSTASEAKKGGYDMFCTTLTVSPHKNAELINCIGSELSSLYGIEWLLSDFKKQDGYLRSIRLSQQYGLYRQCYCGCIYSLVTDVK